MATSHLHKPVRQISNMSLYYTGDIAIIVIDRGENRLNSEFLEAFTALLDDVERNPSCKGLITTGSGKFYGNGLDLDWMGTLSPEELQKFLYDFSMTSRRLLLFPVPTMAAVNGHAFAGGAVFAFLHDLRAMRNDKGWICFNEVFISMRFSDFLYSFLRTKIGSGRNFTDAIVLGRRYNAQDAFNAGLIHAIPSESLLISESIRLLKNFYGKHGYPRKSLANIKEDVYREVLEIQDKELEAAYAGKSKL